MGVYMLKGPFWALATEQMPPATAAASIAAINAVGNLGGFLGPYLIGAIKEVREGGQPVAVGAGAAWDEVQKRLPGAARARRASPVTPPIACQACHSSTGVWPGRDPDTVRAVSAR